LQPIDDGFPAPPDAGKQIDDAWFNAILGSISPPLRAVHPERLWIPLVDAFAAGLYFFWNGSDEIVCIPRPALWLSENCLHREDGPAVLWPSGERFFFIHGVEVAATNTR
jgi:hypothetical protein